MKNSKILLDTNIIIHRETEKVINLDIGKLFNWLDKINAKKLIHPVSVEKINRLKDKVKKQTFNIKLDAYEKLITKNELNAEVKEISDKNDISENDKNDSYLLNEVFIGTVDILITEDRKIHTKAKLLGISEKVFTIESFLEKVSIEFPDLTDYKVLSVHKSYFGNVNLNDPFFASFKEDYPEFEPWFRKKSNELVYISTSGGGNILAFLYLKVEDDTENYSDIEPIFSQRNKRLKIGTFKVALNGFKLGERFLKIVFDNAIQQKVEEIYVTIFDKRDEQKRLINLLEEWGFTKWGNKKSTRELVYVKNFTQSIDINNPQKTYPFISLKENNNVFIVPIWPDYHTELLPDSILRTESPDNFKEDKPYRNAISKVYISRSLERGIKKGDIILFYRTTEKDKPAYYNALLTTIGIVDNVYLNFKGIDDFISKARKRSIFSDDKLKEWWDYTPKLRPFLINFLHVSSLSPEQRTNLIRKELLDMRILTGEKNELRGLKPIKKEQLISIIKKAGINESYFIY
ncbi:PIN domain-containing protein [Stygiobacter electus]|uniref:PIN domain-containing protein n=1 Tax=Stygiobacter electus TaxID=3032292 RepID=A0AAE3P2I8_9BACT|nr:PIN domain-containing protein [Stygiobacter electus]MDF1612894.1 PIN domain-containing protein [Stygiobacter electus]